MNDRWQDRERWMGDRGRDNDDDEYQRRHYGYGEARDYWRNTEPRYGERHRGERSSEYSSLPGIGTNYGGGGWLNEYSQDWRRYGSRPRQEGRQEWRPESRSEWRSDWRQESRPESWSQPRELSWGRDDPSRYRGGYDEERGWWDRTKDEVRSWMGDQDAERRRQADHYGRGPKGYTRSDERIREDVSDRLMADWEVDATDIEVTVSGCEVTLSGSVGDRQSKRRAEDIAANVLGVKDVQNSLRVRKVDPFASGREAASMNQGSSTSPGQATSSTTTVGASAQTPRH